MLTIATSQLLWNKPATSCICKWLNLSWFWFVHQLDSCNVSTCPCAVCNPTNIFVKKLLGVVDSFICPVQNDGNLDTEIYMRIQLFSNLESKTNKEEQKIGSFHLVWLAIPVAFIWNVDVLWKTFQTFRTIPQNLCLSHLKY